MVTIDLYKHDRSDFALLAKLGSEASTPLESVDSSANTFGVGGDWSAELSAGHSVRIVESPQSDGLHEVSSVSYSSADDRTTVTADGSISGVVPGGYVLLPWDVMSDFDKLRAEMRYEPGADVQATWKTADSTLLVQDNHGTGDEMVFLVPDDKLNDVNPSIYRIDVEGVTTGGEPFTILKDGAVGLHVIDDITRI